MKGIDVIRGITPTETVTGRIEFEWWLESAREMIAAARRYRLFDGRGHVDRILFTSALDMTCIDYTRSLPRRICRAGAGGQ